MELLILIITIILLAEVTFLVARALGEHPRHGGHRKVYVDTSALMDPRLLAVAQTGFIGYDLIITRSVTNELQMLADGKDSEKRARARAGLERVRELERVVFFSTEIYNDPLDHTPVDNRLLELARASRGLILTNDFNLEKVAETEHVDVLNLNRLALVLRNEFLPGEKLVVKIVATGSGPKQGVGYLPNGTMVVVDGAAHNIDQEIEAEVLRLNQTAAGTMIFAKSCKSLNKSRRPRRSR